MSTADLDNQISRALVEFSTNGAFPEEEAVSAAVVTSSLLPTVLGVLTDAKAELESEIRQISSESAPDVDDWIRNAKAIHDDIENSRKLASSIVRQAEADEERLEVLQQKGVYEEFLSKEVHYNSQLLSCLKAMQEANQMLSQLESQASKSNIVDALYTLADSFTAISKVPLENTTRAVRLLDKKATDLRDHLKERLFEVWDTLVHFEHKKIAASVTISETVSNEATSLGDTVVAFQSFKEIDVVAKKLWDNLDATIFLKRTAIGDGSLPKIQVNENTLCLSSDSTDRTIKTLFTDLEVAIQFLNERLPREILDTLSRRMMPILTTRILEDWLDTAVPASLNDMVEYQIALAQVDDFASRLDFINWPGGDSLHNWVSNAPKIWLNKRRETALDWTRNQLSFGIGEPQLAEKSETRMVARDDEPQATTTGAVVNDEWDAAWDGDEPEPVELGAPTSNGRPRNRNSLDEERRHSEVTTPPAGLEELDDAADAWGFDDDAVDEGSASEAQQAEQNGNPLERRISPETREVTLSEKYWASSLPLPVFNTVVQIYSDGAQLTKPESERVPVAPSAPGLFALPTLILAMYRAISPYYYTNYPGGNMYLYNDATWLASKLKEFVMTWNARDDLPPRAYGMVRLDPEIKVLESFGKRAYTNELIAQRTIINDLLNGAQNFFQQPPSTLSNAITPILTHIRAQAHVFTTILPYSASCSATGSLVNTIASKLISDVFDLSDIGVDEAERIATIISQVEALDDLFLPKNNPNHSSHFSHSSPSHPHPNADEQQNEIPLTPQFAPLWLKLKFLSEVLQSNLKDVKYLWFESDLSLYFSREEVLELIALSFEMNVNTRALVREIREREIVR